MSQSPGNPASFSRVYWSLRKPSLCQKYVLMKYMLICLLCFVSIMNHQKYFKRHISLLKYMSFQGILLPLVGFIGLCGNLLSVLVLSSADMVSSSLPSSYSSSILSSSISSSVTSFSSSVSSLPVPISSFSSSTITLKSFQANFFNKLLISLAFFDSTYILFIMFDYTAARGQSLLQNHQLSQIKKYIIQNSEYPIQLVRQAAPIASD